LLDFLFYSHRISAVFETAADSIRAVMVGAGFGVNGTIIGSTANIVVATLSEKSRNPITPIVWNKRGLPVMIGTTLVASLCYFLFFSYLGK
jgi:Na+/H+ antiporter NhaD/arsenite permease-like protein